MKKIVLSIFFLLACLNISYAQFFVDQAKINLTTSRGDSVMGSFYIQNTTEESLPVRVYWEDFDYVEPFDGTKNFLPSGTGNFSAHGWVTFSPKEFTLPPFGKQQIEYVIKVPENFDQGSYGVMFFERAGDPIRDITGVQIVTRVGTLFFIEPKNTSKKALLDEIKVEDQKIKGVFINQSKIILIPKMSYYILDEEGNMLDRNYLKNLYVPINAKALWETTISKDLKAGHYTLMLNADLDGGDIAIKEIDFVKDANDGIQIQTIRD